MIQSELGQLVFIYYLLFEYYGLIYKLYKTRKVLYNRWKIEWSKPKNIKNDMRVVIYLPVGDSLNGIM